MHDRARTGCFAAGIETACLMALTAGVTIEVRHWAAIATLQGFAQNLEETFLAPPATDDPMRRVFAAIAADPTDSGTVECPTCKGPLRWRRDSFNDHLSGECKCDLTGILDRAN